MKHRGRGIFKTNIRKAIRKKLAFEKLKKHERKPPKIFLYSLKKRKKKKQ
jgi:hypothetical protein